MENNAKKIFIVGCPRSGTTLLQSMLLNLEGSYSMPETHFFDLLPDNNYVAPRSLPPLFPFVYKNRVDGATCKRVIDAMKKHSRLVMHDDSVHELHQQAKGGTLSVAELFEAVVQSYNKHGKELLIEKTPTHIFHVPYIRALFPDALIVHIVRDPRDVYPSFNGLLEKLGKRKRTVREFCVLWNYCIEMTRVQKIKTVRYEDLVQRPLEATNALLASTGMSVTALDEENYKQIVKPHEVWHANLGKKIIATNFGKYKTILSKEVIAEIEVLCLDGMRAFGYTPYENAERSFFVRIRGSFFWAIQKGLIYVSVLLAFFKRKIHNLFV